MAFRSIVQETACFKELHIWPELILYLARPVNELLPLASYVDRTQNYSVIRMII
jgi:hypothetical protein